MSIETFHNSKEIDSMFYSLNIKDCSDVILKKSEKCRIIRDYNYNNCYSMLYPDSFRSIIHSDTPMLCLRMKSLENAEQIELWKSDDYIAEEKVDGLRCYIVYNYEYGKNNGYELFSRENDEDTLLPKNITSFLTRKLSRPDNFYKNFLLDCELVVKVDGSFELYCFDCLFFNDNYIIDECLYFRRYITEHIVYSMSDRCVKLTNYVKSNKISFFNYIKSVGGEGVVIKNINSKYTCRGSRSKYNWIKVKGNVCDFSLIDDTLEGYVSDSVCLDGLVSLSAFIDGNDSSNKVAEVPYDYFRYINYGSSFNFGLGSVVEFSSTFFSQKDRLFKNVCPIKVRVDKSIKDCSYANVDLLKWSA